MSTNKTPNYQLHSWLPQDEFHVSEINENFTKLDQAVKAEATAAAQKAAALETSLVAGLSPRPRIVTGTYEGLEAVNHDTPQRIELGLKPKILLISADYGFMDSSGNPYGGLVTEDANMYGAVLMDDTGFTVRNLYDHRVRPNCQYKTFHYMAFY